MTIQIGAPGLEGLFREAAAALGPALAASPGADDDRVPVLLAADSTATLLDEFLEELIYLAEIEAFSSPRVERLEIQTGDRLSLRSALSGRVGVPDRRLESATCREVRFDHAEGRWRARLVLCSETPTDSEVR